MRLVTRIFTVCLTMLVACVVLAQDPAPELSIKEIMARAHKPPANLLRKVAQGKASAEETKQLLELYKALAQNEPPKGDAQAWADRTSLLVSAAQAAVDGEADAGQKLTKVTNCMACHSAHK
jgi:hypothetical protein